MSTQPSAYLRAAYPLARSTGQQLPRLFTLHWDNHKQRGRRRDKDDWFECWGTLYPDGGVIRDVLPQHGRTAGRV